MATSPLAQSLQDKIEAALPGCVVTIHDPDGAHLSAHVVAPQFVGKTKLAQHRMVYAALGDAFATTLHALQLTTEAPKP
jgi:stress-induced morphogen